MRVEILSNNLYFKTSCALENILFVFTFDMFLVGPKCIKFESLQMNGFIDSNLMIESTDEENKFKLNCPESLRLDGAPPIISTVTELKDNFVTIDGEVVNKPVIITSTVETLPNFVLFNCDDHDLMKTLDQYKCTSNGKVYVY